jgi:hypothetical protein
MPDLDDDELLEALGVEAAPTGTGRYTPREERLIAGFEDILRFHASHGRAPLHGEDRDIFERLYAVRLDRLLASPEARALLAALDTPGLLRHEAPSAANVDDLDDAALLAELGVNAAPQSDDITVLRHVGTFEDRRAAEEVANRTPCRDFEQFKPLFERAERDLTSGVRVTKRFGRDASVAEGSFFILGGQMVYVAEMGKLTRTPNGEPDARLRVIYSNGTESDLLMRSLQRALYKDDTGRRLTETESGPLFGSALGEDDIVSGTIYVLRSKSDHPYVAAHRELIHKIGVTSGKVETRIANAQTDATYLLADVEIVSSYAVANLNSVRLENLIHRLFASVQLDLTIEDRFGNQVRPREWFLVPLHVIDEVVSRIRDGTIMDFEYSAAEARLVKRSAQ